MNDTRYGYTNTDGNCSHTYLLPKVLQQLRAGVGPPPARVADAGCGNGYVASRIASMGYEVVAFDSSSDGIELARADCPLVDFRVASVYDESIGANLRAQMDCVVSLEVIEHLLYPRRLLEFAREALKPGGMLIISTPFHGYLKNLSISLLNGWDRHFAVHWDGGHVKFFSPRTLTEMVSSVGFRELRVHNVGRVSQLWKSTILTARRE